MNPRFRFFASLFAVFGVAIGLFTSAPVAAQEADLQRLIPPSEQVPAKTGSSADMEVIHVTDRLTNSTEGQEALRNYLVARDAGLLPARKRIESFDIGDEKIFNVLGSLQTDEPTWEPLTFVLRSTNNVANVWIDKELNDSFTEENLAELDEHMLHSTPASSFRPDRGIIENDNYLFGDPPNYDGDGKVDILLFDIDEGKSGSCCVLGYVTSADINPGASEGDGNQADVLYVDLPDGIARGVSGIAWIVAHEYQHLIHYAYQRPAGSELTFVNEGLSEWASVVNGYFHRGIGYLSNTSEHNTPLLDWTTSEPLNDYERAGLFTSYIAQHIGLEATGSIVGARLPADQGGGFAIGEMGYRIVLEEHGFLLPSIVTGFHTANFVNDTSIDPLYGHALPQRSGIRTSPTTEIDGSSQNAFEETGFRMNSGAVHYFTWEQVADISLQVDINSSDAGLSGDDQLTNVQLRAFLEHVDGGRTVETVAPGDENQTFAGDFSSFTLVVVNTALHGSTPLRLDLRSTWDEGGSSGLVRQTVAYDNGIAVPTNLNDARYISLGAEAHQASRFSVQEGARLSAVHFAPIYENQFVDENGEPALPDGLPRDFQILIWADDGTGRPGEELYSVEVDDNPTGTHIDFSNHSYSFLEYELPSSDVLENLPETIYVGISNSGSDENFLVLSVSEYLEESVSFLYLPSLEGWAGLSDIYTSGAPGDTTWVFENHTFPIRAEFVITTPTDAEDPLELPDQVTLSQNYPNPFNPATSITFDLPKTMHARLAVYDALGRRVATVVDGVRSAGNHSVHIDAGGWASGVYFYTLETDVHTISKRMVLMK